MVKVGDVVGVAMSGRSRYSGFDTTTGYRLKPQIPRLLARILA